jgi:hypothetical protein
MTQDLQTNEDSFLNAQIKKEGFFTVILILILAVSVSLYFQIGRNYEENFIETEDALSTS